MRPCLLLLVLAACQAPPIQKTPADSANLSPGPEETDAGIADAGVADAGNGDPITTGTCFLGNDAGFVRGPSPLGQVDLNYVVVGSEPFGACPHLTVYASAAPLSANLVFSSEFTLELSFGDPFALPLTMAANARLELAGGGPAMIPGRVTLERADRLMNLPGAWVSGRIQLNFQGDPPWRLSAVVDAPDCFTWLCIP